MCYGFPCGWWNGWTETCSKPRGEVCPELLAADMPIEEDEYTPAPPPRTGRLGSGFWVSCKVHQLSEALAALRKKYGESVILWGREMALEKAA